MKEPTDKALESLFFDPLTEEEKEKEKKERKDKRTKSWEPLKRFLIREKRLEEFIRGKHEIKAPEYRGFFDGIEKSLGTLLLCLMEDRGKKAIDRYKLEESWDKEEDGSIKWSEDGKPIPSPMRVDILTKAAGMSAREFSKFLRKTADKLDEEYDLELKFVSRSKFGYPMDLKWISNDRKGLNEIFEKYHLDKLLNFIDRESRRNPNDDLSWRSKRKVEGIEEPAPFHFSSPRGLILSAVMERYRPVPGKYGYDFATFIIDGEFYKKLKAETNLEERTTRYLMNELVRIGILKRVQRIKNKQIYADGYWLPYRGKQKKVPFLKAELAEDLRKFRPSWD